MTGIAASHATAAMTISTRTATPPAARKLVLNKACVDRFFSGPSAIRSCFCPSTELFLPCLLPSYFLLTSFLLPSYFLLFLLSFCSSPRDMTETHIMLEKTKQIHANTSTIFNMPAIFHSHHPAFFLKGKSPRLGTLLPNLLEQVANWLSIQGLCECGPGLNNHVQMHPRDLRGAEI